MFKTTGKKLEEKIAYIFINHNVLTEDLLLPSKKKKCNGKVT